MVKIAFCLEDINVRGTTVALFDYAKYNEEILNNESIVVMNHSAVVKSDPIAVVRVVSRFKLLTYKTLQERDDILEKENCDILYCIKYGKNNGDFSSKIKTVIHCVFDMSEPHGDVYAGVSKEVAQKYGQSLFVPHMIGLTPSKTKENIREELGIPDSAIVFGRYGGMDTCNIQFCWKAISDILEKRKDIYFLFINTPKIINHPHVMYLPKVVTEEAKNRFICTCDAHLECGTLGHSFGLAIGEFSVNNKPIIAFSGPNLWNNAHLAILKDRGLYFKNYEEFYKVLDTFRPEQFENRNMNCYEDYMPDKVMAIFKKVFID